MIAPISVIIHAEDSLLLEMGERILRFFGGKYRISSSSAMGGKGNVLKRIPNFNQSAENGNVHFVLLDLDSTPPHTKKNCPAQQRIDLLKGRRQHPDFILRFAVSEVESWLLADDRELANFLQLRSLSISDADSIKDSKEYLLRQIEQKGRSRAIRSDMLPAPGDTRKVGPLYQSRLIDFAINKWDPNRAARKSESLRRAFRRLRDFRPAPRP